MTAASFRSTTQHVSTRSVGRTWKANQVMMLDVLVIGGGPHALTLTSLLTHPDPGPNAHPGSDSPTPLFCSEPPRPHRGPKPSNNKRHSGKKREVSKDVCQEEQPLSQPFVGPTLSLQVVDACGRWTDLWRSQFTVLSIPHLRSHSLVHTDPHSKNALLEFALKHNRSDELHHLPDQVHILDENAFFNDRRLGRKEKKRLQINSPLKKSLDLSLPGTELSVDFFRDQVERYSLDKVLVRGTATNISPVLESESRDDSMNDSTNDGNTDQKGPRTKRRVKYFEVELQDGTMLKARQVVMATGPTRAQMANIPSWVTGIGEDYPEERLQHTVHLMHLLTAGFPKKGLRAVCESGQRVMVVGGGLTSAHVVSLALQHGARHVTWVMRKHLQLKQFDVGDVEGLVGRYSHVEHGIKMDGRAYLRQFYNERSLHKRLAMIHQARKGGAVTPEAYVHLRPFNLDGQVDVQTYCQVSEASWSYKNQTWSLSLSTGHHWTGDMIWLATGCKLDVKQDPLLAEVMREFPIQVMDGWPCVSESLQWAEGCPIYLMGQYAALQIGPHAVNLAGGQAASVRIAKDILRHQQDGCKELREDKPKAEEYIQQMQGLLWL